MDCADVKGRIIDHARSRAQFDHDAARDFAFLSEFFRFTERFKIYDSMGHEEVDVTMFRVEL